MLKHFIRWGQRLGSVLLVAGLSACAIKDNAVFVTKTSFTLVDLDSTASSISIGYDRQEGYAGPRLADGSVFPVAGYIALSGKGFERDVAQVFAAGKAARIVTSSDGSDKAAGATGGNSNAAKSTVAQDPKAGVPSADAKVLFFATATTVGLKLGFADGGVAPTSFALGYKRKELTVVPVLGATEPPSVLATFDNSAGVEKPQVASTATNGSTPPATAGATPVTPPHALFGVKQFFATGVAADNLAARQDIHNNFTDAANTATNFDQSYYTEKANQSVLVLGAVGCVMSVSDKNLDKVWANADALGVFQVDNAAVHIRSQTIDHQRARYLLELEQLMGAGGAAQTQKLGFHKQFVCGLSASTN
jgi:hypothetical protein